MARVDLMGPPVLPERPVPIEPAGPTRRRLLWAAFTGSGMLTGIYWTFPPIFADVDSDPARVVEAPALVRTASLDELPARSLPDVPLTESIKIHRESIAMLEEGIRRIKALGGYTGEFSKQEVVGGELIDPQRMTIKLRHEPFSVYMKWIEGKPGQELLYVDGKNDGEMIVRPGGWKGRVLGTLKLDPNGSMALAESRHPVTQAGLVNLAKTILGYRYDEASWAAGYVCRHDQAEFDGRLCHRFTTIYDKAALRPEYRKSVIYLDREWLAVTHIENYGWPADDVSADRLDQETLVESYSYTRLNFDTELAAVDFDVANREYGLRRR